MTTVSEANVVDAVEVEAMKGPTVTVEQGKRGTGRRLDEQTSLQMDDELANVLRIMKANEGRGIGDILREALEKGLPRVAGHKRARSEYAGGRRIAKAPATGGRQSGDSPAGGMSGQRA